MVRYELDFNMSLNGLRTKCFPFYDKSLLVTISRIGTEFDDESLNVEVNFMFLPSV